MNDHSSRNATPNVRSTNFLSAQGTLQDGVDSLGQITSQQQGGGMSGIMGNGYSNIGILQGGEMGKMNNMNAGNGMNGMMNNMNFLQSGGSELGNFNLKQSMQMNRNISLQNANPNHLHANNVMKIQQHLQQQQMQQRMILMQQQYLQQQMQVAANMNGHNSQNINFALMAAQQNQNQFNNGASNNPLYQSLAGRNMQHVGGMGLQGQPANMHANPYVRQMMMNQRQNEMGAMGNNANTAGLRRANLGGRSSGVSTSMGESNNLSLTKPSSLFAKDGSRRMRGGVIEPFPEKLHRLLHEVEAAGRADVISFVANGRAFAIHKGNKFFNEIVPLYFRQSHLSSFKRQLNLYGFELINTGPARGGYYHEMFVKDRPDLTQRMRRVAIKVAGGAKEKQAGRDEKTCNTSKSEETDAYENSEDEYFKKEKIMDGVKIKKEVADEGHHEENTGVSDGEATEKTKEEQSHELTHKEFQRETKEPSSKKAEEGTVGV